MTALLAMLTSRAGIAGVGVVMLLLAFGWHKTRLGLKDLEISGLKKQINQVEAKAIEQQNLKEVCELNLTGVRDALSQQNNIIETMEQEADQRVAAAEIKALASLTPAEVIEKKVTGPPGHAEMNLFMIDEFGRGYQ